MSRWSPRQELRIAISPEQVTLLMMRRQRGWRGVRWSVHDAYSVPCESAGGVSTWDAAIQALEAALPAYAGGKVAASVMLSNHFMRYTLVPWQAELADPDEEHAFARHCFARIYGESARNWALRLSPQGRAAPSVASAMDAELLESLKAVFERAGIVLQSVQPHLMAAVNHVRGRLGKRSAWFAVLEPGNLCLALLQQGRLQRLRSQRVGDAWLLELALVLDREAYVADVAEVPRGVFLWNAEHGATARPETDDWQFEELNPAEQYDAATVHGQRFAWAMAG